MRVSMGDCCMRNQACVERQAGAWCRERGWVWPGGYEQGYTGRKKERKGGERLALGPEVGGEAALNVHVHVSVCARGYSGADR